MKKLSLTIKIPALQGEFNFLIPSNMKVSEARKLVLHILSAEYGVNQRLGNLTLFDLNDNTALSPDFNFEQLNISDGDKLILL